MVRHKGCRPTLIRGYRSTNDPVGTGPRPYFSGIGAPGFVAYACGTILFESFPAQQESCDVRTPPDQHLAADGTVAVTGTYTCSGGPTNIILGDSVLNQKDNNVTSPSTTMPGTCDGVAHPYTIHFPAGGFFSFEPGPATFTSVWLFYDAEGNPTEAELANTPITLQH
ncbi:DUF6299 family protein [Nocardia sp. CA-128927]|uniref:DUF6299 family protein n=1 Tax=Nocardia sp. CA-128927 TaxID=3239975 RepID=UPI003D9734A4